MGVQINGDTGNVIATKGTFSGDVGIGGTLTYEDVTNVDSVGLITARQGIKVGSGVGVAASISVDGNAEFAGIVTATTFKGDGSQLSNITSTTINNNADNRLITGSGTANTLEGESSLTYSSTGDLTQTVTVDGKGIVLSAGNVKPMITGDSNRSAAGNTILGVSGKWNGTEVARIAVEAGADTTNKDDGTLNFSTRVSGGSLTKHMVIDSNGYVHLNSQPIYHAYGNTSTGSIESGDNDVPLGFDSESSFSRGITDSNSRSRFTVPVAGIYHVQAMVSGSVTTSSQSGDGVEIEFRKNGNIFPASTYFPAETLGSESGQEFAFNVTAVMELAASDYIEVVLSNIGSATGNWGNRYFLMYKIM